MKRLKKLFVTLMAVATVSNLFFATSLAADEAGGTDQKATAVTGVTFTKEFVSENGGVLPNETFTFTMTPDTSETGTNQTSDGLTIKSGLDLGEKGTVDLEFGAGKDATQTGTFSLQDVPFEGPAAYRYIVQEVKPATPNPNITYDEKTFTVDVLVDNNNTPVVVQNVGEGNASLEKKPILFTNQSATDELVVTKTVTGAMGDKNKQFSFTMEISTAAGLAAGAKVSGNIIRGNGSKDPVTFTVGGSETFTLADGEQLVIGNAPHGMVYTVSESKYDDYQTSIAATIAGGTPKNVDSLTYDASANGQNTPIADGGNTIAFTNHKEIIRTGITLDVIPYLTGIVLLTLGAGMVIVFARKKTAGYGR